MKILVIDSIVPFENDRIGEIARALVHHLNARGDIESELLRIPHRNGDGERLLADMDVCQNLRLENVDRVIALRFPSYLVHHRHKTLWLLQQCTQSWVPNEPTASAEDRKLSDIIQSDDTQCFTECRRIFVGSLALGQQIETHNHATSHLLRPPVINPVLLADGEYGDYIFANGIPAPNRLEILIKAISRVSAARLIIAGVSKDSPQYEPLRGLITANNLVNKVTLELGSLSHDKTASFLKRALAYLDLSSGGNSLGLDTIEAFAAAKPILAVTDFGEKHEIVIDGETGKVVPATVEALANALDSLFSDRERTIRMGQAAHQTLNRLDLTWPRTVETLLAPDLGPSGDQGNGAKIRRNAPCPCGSGKRYKHCHGRYN